MLFLQKKPQIAAVNSIYGVVIAVCHRTSDKISVRTQQTVYG